MTRPGAASAARLPRSRHDVVLLILVAVAICIAYWPAMTGGFVWDDDAHVPRPELRSLGGLVRIWSEFGATQQYYPLLYSFFWLQHRLWGDHTPGYHLVNLLLHLVTVGLVYRVLRELEIPGAAWAAAVFALHPVHVETVAWLTEQKNTLSAVLYLGALLAYLRFDESRRARPYGLALGLFVLAVLSKPVTVTLPPALLVIFWWRRGTLSARRDVLPLAPFFTFALTAGTTIAWLERHLIGAQGAAFDLTVLERPLLAGRIVWFYFAKLVWPADLLFVYPRWTIDAAVWWQWLFPLGAVAGLGLLWSMRQTSRAPLAAFLFFVGTLFPVLGFFNVYYFRYAFVADHFQYLASLGVIVFAAGAVARWVSRRDGRVRLAGGLAGVLLLAVLAVLTWRQERMYSDVITLWRTTLAGNPHAWLAHNNLGVALMARGQPREAMEHLRQALRLNPDFVETHNSLGAALLGAGQPAEATRHFEEALRLDPRLSLTHTNLGKVLLSQGQLSRAVEHLRQALRLKPGNPEAENTLGAALVNAGRPREAIEHFEGALRSRPDFADAHNNLGAALFGLGRAGEAMEHYRHALRLRPGQAGAHYNLGVALLRAGRPGEAIGYLAEAVRLRPDLADANHHRALMNLGVALAAAGRTGEAIETLERAVQIRPDFAEAWAALASANAGLNRSAAATAAARKALELARAQGNEPLARQLDAWLASARARGAGAPAATSGATRP